MEKWRKFTGIIKISGILMLIFFANSPTIAQTPKEIKITPYTIETTYQKLKKDYPFVTPVTLKISENIKAKENILYRKIGERELKADV